jgi:hypothetical protein
MPSLGSRRRRARPERPLPNQIAVDLGRPIVRVRGRTGAVRRDRRTGGRLRHRRPTTDAAGTARAVTTHRKAEDRALKLAHMGSNAVDEQEPIPAEATKSPA